MENGWLDRLHAALEKDGRSMRAISTAAKCGPNFIQQMIKDQKEPGADKLARILEVLGQDAALYILAGVPITKEDIEFIKIIRGLGDSAREDALRLFRGLQSGEAPLTPHDDQKG